MQATMQRNRTGTRTYVIGSRRPRIAPIFGSYLCTPVIVPRLNPISTHIFRVEVLD